MADAELRSAPDTLTASGGRKSIVEIGRIHRSLAKRWPGRSEVAELGESLR